MCAMILNILHDSIIVFLSQLYCITVDAIEVLIKYSINLLPRIDQFIAWKIDQIPVCLTRPIAFHFSD